MVAESRTGTPSPIPGYQSLSPPPRMSALPLAAVPSGMPPSAGGEFQRSSPRYSSLPSHFRSGRMMMTTTPNYNQWLPGTRKEQGAAQAGRESPEEGGFLEFNNNNSNSSSNNSSNNNNNNSNNSKESKTGNESFSSSSDGSEHVQRTACGTPTPSVSSCSLDVSFTSSMNDSTEVDGLHLQRKPESLSPLALLPALIKRTTIGDFKRKLLQHSKSPSNHRVSAVEMLKATKPATCPAAPAPIQLPASPLASHPALENLIRRSARVSYIANRLNQRSSGSGRFRTDVLSATIVEGRSEEESADSLTPSPVDPLTQLTQAMTPSPGSPPGVIVRRHLSFKTPPAPSLTSGSASPPSGASTPIETSL